VGPSLCYESLFGGSARGYRRGGADLLVNLSSDVWFGDDTAVMGSWFLSQHPAHLVLRAVETRTSVARAANGGFSGFIDPRGRWLPGGISPGSGGTWAVVPVFRGMTLYTRLGDVLGPLCLVLAVFLAWRPSRGGMETEEAPGRAG
jgi:apolipoprotein N-acyltransferase